MVSCLQVTVTVNQRAIFPVNQRRVVEELAFAKWQRTTTTQKTYVVVRDSAGSEERSSYRFLP